MFLIGGIRYYDLVVVVSLVVVQPAQEIGPFANALKPGWFYSTYIGGSIKFSILR